MNYDNHVVLVDGMNIAYRCSFIYDKKQKLSTADGVPTGTIYGFARHMVKLRDTFPGAEFYVVWEGRNSIASRQEIIPEYKAGRHDEDTSDQEEKPVYSQLNALGKLLEAVGIHQASAEGYEADDVLGTLSRQKEAEGHNVVLVSSDRDLLQLVTDKVVMMLPKGNKFYDADKVREEYGVSPEDFLTYKCLDGDKSDNLPGLYRFPRKKITAMVNEHEDLESIYTKCGLELTEFQTTTLNEFEDQAFKNRQVMGLKDVEAYHLREGEHDESEIESICSQLEFESIKTDLLSFPVKTGFVKTGEQFVGLLHSTSGSTGAGQ